VDVFVCTKRYRYLFCLVPFELASAEGRKASIQCLRFAAEQPSNRLLSFMLVA
jgi:hypothetical protein